MGWYGLSVGAAPVIAPTIAGFLVDSVGWRMIFCIAILCSSRWSFAVFVFDNVENVITRFDAVLYPQCLCLWWHYTGHSEIWETAFVSFKILLPLAVVGCTARSFSFIGGSI